MFQRPDLHRNEPTDFSVIPRPPSSVSEISHNGTASYIVYDAHPPAKRMMSMSGIGHSKIKGLDGGTDESDRSDSALLPFPCLGVPLLRKLCVPQATGPQQQYTNHTQQGSEAMLDILPQCRRSNLLLQDLPTAYHIKRQRSIQEPPSGVRVLQQRVHKDPLKPTKHSEHQRK